MQIHGHVDKRFRPEPSNKITSQHRQKRKGRRKDKKLGNRAQRKKFKQCLDGTCHKNITKLIGHIEHSPMFNTDICDVYGMFGDSVANTTNWKPPPRNKKIFAKWRKHQ